MEVKLTVPDSLNEISLRQYQEWLKLEDKFNNPDYEDFLNQKMIEIFCGIKLSHVLLISRKDVKETANHLVELLNQRPEHAQTFKIKGQEFGMIPNLDSMSMGEYIDLDTYITDWQEMSKAMAVLYRPIARKVGERYELVEYQGTEDTAHLMEFMPLGVVFGAMLFFYRLGNELLTATQNYLVEELTETATIAIKHNLPKSMDGIIQSMHSQKEILERLIRSQLTTLDNV